jgi:hypothetical protein
LTIKWVLHLLEHLFQLLLPGDIHQPVHCVALYSSKYPDGDRGGNAIRIRISTSPTNLHSFWDGLLGRGTTAGEIGKNVADIAAVFKEKRDSLPPEFEKHRTPENWAKEGAALARHTVYLDGEPLKAYDDGQGVAGVSVVTMFPGDTGPDPKDAPENSGAVGPDHVVDFTNANVLIHDKTTGIVIHGLWMTVVERAEAENVVADAANPSKVSVQCLRSWSHDPRVS